MGDNPSAKGGGAADGGGNAADAYIGSLISLTSKSEIRYEGILYTIDTANLNIALQDVRSFGTEGRKKDGPQVPASDKVYDFIIFRGSDIKDLQVKSSPPGRLSQSQQPYHDPAIISLQSQTSPMAPPVTAGNRQTSGVSTATTQASTDIYNRGLYSNIPSGNYQPNLPMYQPYTGLSPWGMPPIPPGSNGTMGMPMYWPDYYRPGAHLQQQSPLPFQALPPNYIRPSQSPPKQPLPVSTTTTTTSSVPMPDNLVLQSESAKDSVVNSSAMLSSSNLPLPVLPSSFQVSAPLDYSSSVLSVDEKSAAVKLASKVSLPSTSSTVPISMSGSLINQNAVSSLESTALLETGIDSQKHSVVSEHFSVDQSAAAEPTISTTSTSQAQSSSNQPLLPLPVRPKNYNQGYGASSNSGYNRRGRGRGGVVGNAQSQSQFMEDFDFTAMNEKFKKDEVWGELGKADSREKGDGEDDLYDDAQYEEEEYTRPVYVKDDFFDTLSCDALDRGNQVERTKFSEQRKIDTETFGRFSLRSRGSRGGRGAYRGNSRGNYYGGRFAGNGGRGRGYARNTAGY
ncbi:hypothetical protein KP509_20G085100 [Ceratopteris richardii]|uniref:Protein decapping 5 n=1 Tax=Ceratopteris richardii TaxID=49495 RepID=A0A8T2SIU8_CERRI|nr:hypothetical protein KP509_20G085100 [Ceratopteris richardii]KAH7332393.1 hypothetical protein KP509_20G085100 [Ceratopteris richardii]